MNRAIVTACFGDRREQLQTLLQSVAKYVDNNIPIHLYTDDEGFLCEDGSVTVHITEAMWRGHPRSGVRASNFVKLKSIQDLSEVDSFCLIDDDMEIVDAGFMEGFDLAERFGVALPMNPRIYTQHMAQSADVPPDIMDMVAHLPQKSTACNFSPFFYRRGHSSQAAYFMIGIREELSKGCRGTLAVWKASWDTKYTPLYLPEQWCVCGDHVEHIRDYTIQLKGQTVPIKPICLHLGHEAVRKAFRR